MWLLLQSIHDDLQSARAAGFNFTAEQIAQHDSRLLAADTSRVMAMAGDSAEIHVKGVLTNTPDMFAQWFGGGNTTYPEIISALAEADANPEIKEIVMRFDSGGGSINGMFDAIAAMQTTKTPIRAIVGSMAASAAYGLASQADTIEAHNRASTVGSIGIVVDTYLDADAISITSTNAQNKRPDLATEEGRAVLVEHLDAVHDLFAEAISDGRSTTVETVNADFGQGAVLLADEALKRGMIDSVAKVGLQSVKSTNLTTAKSGDQLEATTMDLKELKATHPTLCAQLVAEGEEIGTTAERENVKAHLTMGEASGDMKTAIEAINAGIGMTTSLQAKYMAAGMNRNDISAREEENAPEVGAGEDLAPAGQEADEKASASILAAAFEKCGVEMEA
jgi:ClpP class serine protease